MRDELIIMWVILGRIVLWVLEQLAGDLITTYLKKKITQFKSFVKMWIIPNWKVLPFLLLLIILRPNTWKIDIYKTVITALVILFIIKILPKIIAKMKNQSQLKFARVGHSYPSPNFLID